MKIIQTLTQKLTALTAVAVLAGGLGFGAFGFGASASAQAVPTTRADCANWRDYGFSNRAACVSFVTSNNNNNGYGGNGGGNGGNIGAIGRVIQNILSTFLQLIRSLLSFFF